MSLAPPSVRGRGDRGAGLGYPGQVMLTETATQALMELFFSRELEHRVQGQELLAALLPDEQQAMQHLIVRRRLEESLEWALGGDIRTPWVPLAFVARRHRPALDLPWLEKVICLDTDDLTRGEVCRVTGGGRSVTLRYRDRDPLSVHRGERPAEESRDGEAVLAAHRQITRALWGAQARWEMAAHEQP